MLGYNIILRPLLLGDTIQGYYGILLFPGFFASTIEQNLMVNIGWSLALLIFSMGYFLLRPRSAPLTQEAIAAFSGRFKLTAREEEITALLVQGIEQKTIGDSLFISVKTVKAHVYNIYQKAGVNNRLELFEKIRKSI